MHPNRVLFHGVNCEESTPGVNWEEFYQERETGRMQAGVQPGGMSEPEAWRLAQ